MIGKSTAKTRPTNVRVSRWRTLATPIPNDARKRTSPATKPKKFSTQMYQLRITNPYASQAMQLATAAADGSGFSACRTTNKSNVHLKSGTMWLVTLTGKRSQMPGMYDGWPVILNKMPTCIKWR